MRNIDMREPRHAILFMAGIILMAAIDAFMNHQKLHPELTLNSFINHSKNP